MRQRSKNKLSTALLVLILLVLGIGYAYLSTTLSINGVTDVDRNVWDIYFDNAQVTTGSVTGEQEIEEPTITSDTEVEFHVRLKEPGEFYEFTVEARNDGTIDAMINSLSKKLNNVEVTTLPAYLRYDVTYSDGIPIAENHLLAAESLETYKVRVEYRNDINPSDLPSTAQNLTLSFGVEYVQADENAVPVPHPNSFATDSWETIIFAVQNGITSAYNVGDTKTIELGNNLGTHTLRIANKSTPAECSNSGYSQTACGFVLEFADIISTHAMRINTNEGGWPASLMRPYLNDIDDNTSIINSLPNVLQNEIIDTLVISGHGNNTGETDFTSVDKLFLFSFVEVYGFDHIRDTVTLSKTRQLDYYAGIPVTDTSYTGVIKKMGNTQKTWWLRSANANDSSSFKEVDAYGHWSNNTYCYGFNNYGVSPAFRLG